MVRKILMIVLVFMVFVSANLVYADAPTTNWPSANTGVAINKVEKTTKNTVSTIALVAQILALAAVVFSGLRYMFASADKRADIKQGLIYLVIGCLFVFMTSTLVKFIVDSANDIL